MNHENAKMFDYIDIVILHSDYETYPWFACNAKLLQFMKQVIVTNKHCFASEHIALFVPYILSTGGYYAEVINSNGVGGNLRDIKYTGTNGLLPWNVFLSDNGDFYVYDTHTSQWVPTVNCGFRKIKINEKSLKSHRSHSAFGEKSFLSLVNRKFANHWVVKNLKHSYLVDTYTNKFVIDDYDQSFDLESNFRTVYLIENNKGPSVFLYKNILCNLLKFDGKELCNAIFSNFLEHSIADIFNFDKSLLTDYKNPTSIYRRVHFDYSTDYKGWSEKIPEIIWVTHNSKSKSKVKINTDQLTQDSRFQYNDDDLDQSMPLYYTTHLNTHVSTLYSKFTNDRPIINESMISFAKSNNKNDINNISSMQDIKKSIDKENRSQLISPFQVNSRQFSFNLKNNTTDTTLNLNNSYCMTRPMTGNSNISTHNNNRKSSDTTRPGTGKTTRTNKTNITKGSKTSNVNTSHDYSLLNFKGKQVLEGTKNSGGKACADEIIDAIDVTSYKFSKARPQSTTSLRKFVDKYGDHKYNEYAKSKYFECHLKQEKKDSTDYTTNDIPNIDAKLMCAFDEESKTALQEFEHRKQIVKQQNRAPRKFYNNLKNVALSQTYAKCNPWLGDGPTIGCHSKYMTKYDMDMSHERETKQIAKLLHNGKDFKSYGGMDHKERQKYELSSNCHNQPSKYPLANFNFRPESRNMWITDKNFII
eukprot:Mrub_01286.p1 GENE.Mrub_01286~~Mrub_01286.p1  ORF type:complete len:747 (-),score=87.70 Mrub_01286:42-2141(-)